MHNTNGTNILHRLRKRWIYKALLSQFLLACALTIFLSVLLYKLFSFSLVSFLPVLIILFFITVIINRSWRLSSYDVSRFLNITNPFLQESAQLVLKPETSLTLFEKLQVKKVESELLSLKIPDPLKKRFVLSLLILAAAIVSGFILFKIPFNFNTQNKPANTKQIARVNSIPEKLLPEIKKVNVTITPPAYTGNEQREQDRLNVSAEEGSTVSWQIQTNLPAKQVQLIFNDGSTLLLTSDKQLSWKTQKQIKTSGFYQIKIDYKLSDLYKIESIKDQPPTIAVQAPKPNTYINYGQSEKVLLKTSLVDDYGIISANISATISSGNGEAVKFKEQKLSFENFAGGNKQYQLQKMIDCKALGMQPGDELYFFVTTTDNHHQQSRSEVYIITLKDTTNLTGIEGMVLPLDIKPELFRSQRQIIIETEQLHKDKPNITAEKFRQKSNELGMDQKLLRMRYSKFLGEETNVEIGGEDDHGNQDYTNNADEIIEQFTHKHDNSEDASFFDAATKKQLVATLTEMWNAELKLKTFLPKEALPYENKALLLLKDLQQKSRAYVPKTGFKSTPLKLDKRLTGDLTKINQPVTQQEFKKPEASAIIIRRALGILEQLESEGTFTSSSKEILQQAFLQLGVTAANQPSVYLTSLSALRKILDGDFRIKDIDNAEQGLHKLTAPAEKFPYSNDDAGMKLSKQYFIYLNKNTK